MSQDYCYTYPPLLLGKLRSRYKRFFAEIELMSGEIITAHCANTGPMIGVSEPESLVYVSQSDNPKRKLAYTWELIQVDGTWVGINTNLPNKIVKTMLEKSLIPELVGEYTQVRTEVIYGRENSSRIDFLLTSEQNKPPIYLEVKNTTLAENHLALFPDTTTTRGQKHLEELVSLLPQSQAVMLYFINREDCPQFAPGDRYDPTYGKLLREAVSKGIMVLPCRFAVTPKGVRYLGLAEFVTPENYCGT